MIFLVYYNVLLSNCAICFLVPRPYVIYILLLWHDIAYLCWKCALNAKQTNKQFVRTWFHLSLTLMLWHCQLSDWWKVSDRTSSLQRLLMGRLPTQPVLISLWTKTGKQKRRANWAKGEEGKRRDAASASSATVSPCHWLFCRYLHDTVISMTTTTTMMMMMTTMMMTIVCFVTCVTVTSQQQQPVTSVGTAPPYVTLNGHVQHQSPKY